MRLIDVDALDWERIEHEHGARHEAVVDCEQMVEKAPTIDAVPVVRCKDCKRRKNAKENGKVYWDGYKYYCEIARYGVTDGGFCFYGERKDDES